MKTVRADKTSWLNIAYFFTAALCFAFFSNSASALCGTDAAGTLKWNSPKVQLCTGTVWVNVDGTVAGACGTTGQISTVSGNLYFCNGANWIRMNDVGSYVTCTATDTGRFYYGGAANLEYWYCTGSQWRKIGP